MSQKDRVTEPRWPGAAPSKPGSLSLNKRALASSHYEVPPSREDSDPFAPVPVSACLASLGWKSRI